MTSNRIHLPDEFARSLTMLPASELDAFLDEYKKPAWRAARFSSRQKALPQPWCLERVPWAENAWYIAGNAQPGMEPQHWAGAYYIQEPSAMAAVGALSPDQGQAVLDLCAAPGGKSCQIADLMAGTGLLVANDPVISRARELSRNLERMGIRNAVVTSNPPEKLAIAFPGYFDRILVDAPCSGEGMFRKNPDAIKNWRHDLPAELSRIQLQILNQAALMLKPGGRMVYSTCTFNETENERVINAFLRQHSDFSLRLFALPGLPEADKGILRIWPHKARGEGHFIALLQKSVESAGMERPVMPFNRTLNADKQKLLDAANRELAAWLDESPFADAILGGIAVKLPEPCPDLQGLQVLRLGLHLASVVGKTIRPEHALAAALIPNQTLRLDRKEAERFRKGEPLPVKQNLKGYLVVSFEGWPLGWGKAVNGVLKNHYPKGLRNPGKPADE